MNRYIAASKRWGTRLNPSPSPVHDLLLSGVRHTRQGAHQQVFCEACGRHPGSRPGVCRHRDAAPLPRRSGAWVLCGTGSRGSMSVSSHLQPSLRRGRQHLRQPVLGSVRAAGDRGDGSLPERREGTQHGSRDGDGEPPEAWLGVHAGIQSRLRH